MSLIIYPSHQMSSSIVYANYGETIERFEYSRPNLARDNDLEVFSAHCNPQERRSWRIRLPVFLGAEARSGRGEGHQNVDLLSSSLIRYFTVVLVGRHEALGTLA